MARSRFIMNLCVAAAAGMLAAPGADGADASGFRLMPYLWYAGYDGTLGGLDDGSGGSIDADFPDLLDELQLRGFMLNGEWRTGRWSANADWTHVDLEASGDPPLGALYGEAEGEIKGDIFQLQAGYELYAVGPYRVEALLGARFYALDVGLSLQAGALPARRGTGSDSWSDAVVGLRWRAALGDRWDLSAYADVGAGDSDFSWQAAAAVDYRYDWGALALGWRHLQVDYTADDWRMDGYFGGPFLGAVFRF